MANDDMTLLRDYAQGNSEEAFATLVSRHVNLVYSVALRQVHDPHLAEEITQVAFIILARKAAALPAKTVLSAWLCRTARYASANALKLQRRRQRREQEAQMQSIVNDSDSESDAWNQIAPLLDTAMAGLSEMDHSAIVLRFFDGKNLREVGDALGATEEAAKKRVNRALEKLRKFFAHRGITLSALAIAGALSTHALQAAPAGLAVNVVTAAKGTTVAASIATLLQTTLNLMAWTKAKTTAIAGAAAVLAIGGALVIVKTNCTTAAAADPPDIQGAWVGTVADPKAHIENRAVLRIAKTNGTYRATVDLIEQNQKDIPFTSFVYNYPAVRGEIKYAGGNGVLKTTLNSNATELSGTWTDQETIALVLKRTDSPESIAGPLPEADYQPRRGSDLQGYWKGTLASMPVSFKIAEATDGTFRAQFNSVQEGLRNIPAAIAYDRPTVTASLNAFGSVFKGKLDPNRNRIAGSWASTSGRTFPVALERADPAVDTARENSKSYEFSNPDDVRGHWKGTLSTKRNGSKVNLRLDLHLARMPDGSFTASLDSPNELVKMGIEASTVQYSAPHFYAHWIGIGSEFDAHLQNGKISGTWKDDNGPHPLVLERSWQ